MEEYGNNGIFGVDMQETDAGGGREIGNLFGIFHSTSIEQMNKMLKLLHS